MSSSEQRSATESLRRAAPTYRVVPDNEGWPMIPGRLGQIEYHDGDVLAVYTDRARMHGKLLALPGARRHQMGDDEYRLLFPLRLLDAVAKVIRARRKRVLSPEQARNLGARTAYKGVSRANQAPQALEAAP